MDRIIFKILIVLLLIFSCKSDKNESMEFYSSKNLKTEMRLTKVDGFTIKGNQYTEWTQSDSGEMLIGRLFPFFVSTNDASIHAFRDEINQHVIVIDDFGIIQAVIGNIGRGPKEFSKIEMYNFINKQELIISDMGALVFKVMNLDNDLLETIEFDIRTYATQSIFNIFYHNGFYYKPIIERKLGAYFKKHWKSALIAKYDTDGNLISTFGTYDYNLKNPTTFSIAPIIYLDENRELIFSIHSSNHQIQVFDLNTNRRIKWFGYKPRNFVYSEEYIDAFLPREQIMRLVAGTSASDRIFTCERFIYHAFSNTSLDFFVNRDFNKKSYFLAVYDADTFDYHGEIEVPYIIGNIVNGRLYLIENDDPDNYSVGVYKINVLN